ncbi:MAG: NAD(P)-binding domain-containing protein, partial [Dysgonamonadaceae bacterium]|nr:NAD(P)-binding domain-containing protein [Dysgonamonadaceae bacterium]
MKLTIIGGGNMGSAIARGCVAGSLLKPGDITVVDVQEAPLKALQTLHPGIGIALNDYSSASAADIIILAVKPWMIHDTIVDIKFQLDYSKQIIVSIAAGITLAQLNEALLKHNTEYPLPALFRLIPNTAIAIRQSMTLMATKNATPEQQELLLKLFNELGSAVLLDESKMAAGTAITSCGIAYLFRYIRAVTLAGVEMGFYPKEAQNLAVKTMLGAAALLDATGEN